MNKLDDVDTDLLYDALADASDAKATKRLMIALAYADGVRVDTLCARYGIPRATVYSWLDRFEQEPISEAIKDEPRPGRPPKLSDSQREQLFSDLSQPPNEIGYETTDWSPALAKRHVEQVYKTNYSLGHIRRLLRKSRAEYSSSKQNSGRGPVSFE